MKLGARGKEQRAEGIGHRARSKEIRVIFQIEMKLEWI
jgi:hypothetical protein